MPPHLHTPNIFFRVKVVLQRILCKVLCTLFNDSIWYLFVYPIFVLFQLKQHETTQNLTYDYDLSILRE